LKHATVVRRQAPLLKVMPVTDLAEAKSLGAFAPRASWASKAKGGGKKASPFVEDAAR
jgi:hypothetical protein